MFAVIDNGAISSFIYILVYRKEFLLGLHFRIELLCHLDVYIYTYPNEKNNAILFFKVARFLFPTSRLC
jgi:hypothetical protein